MTSGSLRPIAASSCPKMQKPIIQLHQRTVVLGQETKSVLGRGVTNNDGTEVLSSIGKWHGEREGGPYTLGSCNIRTKTRFQGAGAFQRRVRQRTIFLRLSAQTRLLLGSRWEQLVVSAFWLARPMSSTSLSGLI